MKRVIAGVQPSQIQVGDKICIKLTEGLPPDETVSPYQLIWLEVTNMIPWPESDESNEKYFIIGDELASTGWPTDTKRCILTTIIEQIERFNPRHPSEAMLAMIARLNSILGV